MHDNLARCLAFTRAAEGDWANDAEDPGGCTMAGITLATYRAWKNAPATTPEQLRSITPPEWESLAIAGYWNPVNGDRLPAGVDLMCFDFAFNAGVGHASSLLQSAVQATPDGAIGPETIEAVSKRAPFLVIAALAEAQEAYYRRLPTFAHFGKGWLARNAARRAAAVAMLAPVQPAPVPSAPAPEPEGLLQRAEHFIHRVL